MNSLRQTFISLFASVLLFVGVFMGNFPMLNALATTPSDVSQDIKQSVRDQDIDRARRDRLMGNTQAKLKDAAENVKQKLNLDEPIPESTKQFGRDVKASADRAVNKVKEATPNPSGYYHTKHRGDVSQIKGDRSYEMRQKHRTISEPAGGYYQQKHRD